MNLILKCTLPIAPPSVNHYWGANGKRRFLTVKANEFIKIVSLYSKPKHSVKRLKLVMTVCFTDKRRRDIDNTIKAVLDALVRSGLCIDDEQFDELVVKRGEIIKGGATHIEVWEID